MLPCSSCSRQTRHRNSDTTVALHIASGANQWPTSVGMTSGNSALAASPPGSGLQLSISYHLTLENAVPQRRRGDVRAAPRLLAAPLKPASKGALGPAGGEPSETRDPSGRNAAIDLPMAPRLGCAAGGDAAHVIFGIFACRLRVARGLQRTAVHPTPSRWATYAQRDSLCNRCQAANMH